MAHAFFVNACMRGRARARSSTTKTSDALQTASRTESKFAPILPRAKAEQLLTRNWRNLYIHACIIIYWLVFFLGLGGYSSSFLRYSRHLMRRFLQNWKS